MHTAQHTLHTIHCTLQTAHCTMHTNNCTLHTVRCKFVHCILDTSHSTCTLHTAQCALYTEHCTLHTAHFTCFCAICGVTCTPAAPSSTTGGGVLLPTPGILHSGSRTQLNIASQKYQALSSQHTGAALESQSLWGM